MHLANFRFRLVYFVLSVSMEPHLAYHLRELSDALCTGQYQPDPVRFFSGEQGRRGTRVISAMPLRDKVAQRAVLTVINPLGEAIFHHNSYG